MFKVRLLKPNPAHSQPRPLSVLLILLLFIAAPTLAQGNSKEWSVNAPPGEHSEVKLDVTEGTWMSLDVSPDGKTLAFDLLGDLYLLPISGGEARAVTSGLAWNMQPKFSPDGRKLAYTSDRGGGDNLWVMDLSQGEASAKAVTKESFRLLNQPAWEPSGDLLVGRKHFTGTRSLGAGEIWAYYPDGEAREGLQLTKRQNDQLDLGEPAFSPDGRYLYFSRDITAGPTFQYNKDPNAGIYAIECLDRQSGKVERILGGSGGAITPTPSPDGKMLAFVKRVRGRSVLMTADLSSGEERQLFDGLDRDMQETWAIHGVYPAMAWTPDSDEIVFWAQGKLWRLQAKTPEARPVEIPFRVRDTRKITKAVRFPTEVGTDRFSVKALTWPSLSPDGSTVAFSALGQVWLKDLKSGTSKPLSATDKEGHQSQPVFVGPNQLLYVHFSDQDLGSIRLRDLAQNTERTLVDKGRFLEPALSPDGLTLVYRKQPGNLLFSTNYTGSPGLYLKDLSAPMSHPRLLDEKGRNPQFALGPEGQVHLYYSRGGDSTQLVRKSLKTGEEAVVLEGKDVSDFLISPDGKTAALRQDFALYTFPFSLTGQPVTVTASSKNLPVTKVSLSDGAYYPSFAANGELTWNVGPQFYRLPSGQKKPNSNALSWEASASKPPTSSVIALVGGQVITMQEDLVISEGTVLVVGDRIKAVGPKDQIAVPSSAKIIDCQGKTIMPGLIDVHWHGTFSDGANFPEVNWESLSSLSFGVTTLHDPSHDTASVFTAKEMQQAGRLLAPRIFSTGTILYGAKAIGYFTPVDSLDDAMSHLQRMQRWGAPSVKSYNQPRRDQRQQILEAARHHKLLVMPEGGSLHQHNLTMVVDGHTGVEHALPLAKLYDDIITLWSATQVGFTPTLGVAYGGLWGENFWYAKTDVWDDERLARFVPREAIDGAARRRVQAPDEEYNHRNAARGAADLARAGVKVNLGAHGQREGLAAHWELWMLTDGGMSNLEALRCGTYNGAYYLGMDDQLGSLEPGKLADILVLEADPLQDIKNSKYVALTMQGGRLYQADSMAEIAPNPAPEPKIWWRNVPQTAR